MASAKQQYSDRRWRRLRARFIATHPVCQHTDGCDKPSEDVHHLDGQGLAGPLGYHWDNLQALCHSHHSSITAREHGYGARASRRRDKPQHPGLIA